MKLLIHSETLTVQPLKFGMDKSVILDIKYLINGGYHGIVDNRRNISYISYIYIYRERGGGGGGGGWGGRDWHLIAAHTFISNFSLKTSYIKTDAVPVVKLAEMIDQ